MTIKRIKCYAVNCEMCQQHITLKENIFGKKMYTCFAEPKKHKGTTAKKCDEFACNNHYSSTLCNDCHQINAVQRIRNVF